MNKNDGPKIIVKESVTVRKFKLDQWTEEQIASGEAEPYEVLTVEDGIVTNRWRRDGTD